MRAPPSRSGGWRVRLPLGALRSQHVKAGPFVIRRQPPFRKMTRSGGSFCVYRRTAWPRRNRGCGSAQRKNPGPIRMAGDLRRAAHDSGSVYPGVTPGPTVVRVFSIRNLLSLEGIKYAALTAAGTVLLGGAVVASLETEQHWTTWDGVWWAATTRDDGWLRRPPRRNGGGSDPHGA